jgi:hypothetical protein
MNGNSKKNLQILIFLIIHLCRTLSLEPYLSETELHRIMALAAQKDVAPCGTGSAILVNLHKMLQKSQFLKLKLDVELKAKQIYSLKNRTVYLCF